MMSKATPKKAKWPAAFRLVNELGLRFPNVEAAIRYDGSPVLKADGVFMAGIARHASAEPDTLVIRIGLEERAGLLEDAPEAYYVTEHYRRFPVVLVRLKAVTREVLGELLAGSWRIAAAKGRRGRPY